MWFAPPIIFQTFTKILVSIILRKHIALYPPTIHSCIVLSFMGWIAVAINIVCCMSLSFVMILGSKQTRAEIKTHLLKNY
jgi:hypothetical protein